MALDGSEGVEGNDPMQSVWIGVGLVASVLFLVALYQSFFEIRYWCFGAKTTAQVTGVTDDIQAGQRVGYVVWYAFNNQNSGRKVSSSFGIAEADKPRFARGSGIPVEYVGSGLFSARLQSEGSYFWPVMLLVSTTVMVGCIGTLLMRAIRSASEDDEPAEDEADEQPR